MMEQGDYEQGQSMVVRCELFTDVSIRKNMASDSMIVTRLCGQKPCVKHEYVLTLGASNAKRIRSQYTINGSWVSRTRAVMSSSHNSFQYWMNPDIPLMIFGPFLMGLGVQGFGSPSGSIHLPSSFWRYMSIHSFGPEFGKVHKTLNCMAGRPTSRI